jgi:TolB protein
MRLLVFFASILFLIGCGPSISRPTYTPDGQYLIFRLYGTKAEGIYRLKINAKRPEKIQFLDERTLDAVYSPDGYKIAYVHGRLGLEGQSNLFIINSGGTGKTKLAEGEDRHLEPTFSPDGKTVYFLRIQSSASLSGDDKYFPMHNIYAVNIDGSSLKKITPTAHDTLSGPSISPDGRYLLTRIRGENEPQAPATLLILNLETSESEVIKPNLDPYREDKSRAWYTAIDEAVFSPDGISIFFVASLRHKDINEGKDAVYVMERKTHAIKKITKDISPYVRWSSFSPSGNEIVFCSGSPYACSEIWRVNSDGSSLRQLSFKVD